MKILVSAAEASSDMHGAAMVEALRTLLAEKGEKLDVFGVGGPRLQAAGLRVVVDSNRLRSMGFSEILGKIPTFLRALRKLEDAALREKPDIAVLIDYPDFHFRLAARLKKQGIPTVDFIPPKLWVWRKHRMLKLKELYDLVLSILPFEVPMFQEFGVQASYVGNPIVDSLPADLPKKTARRELGLPEDGPSRIVALFLGSRPKEIELHLDPMAQATISVARKMGGRTIALVPLTTDEERLRVEERLEPYQGLEVEFRTYVGESLRCLAASDAGLIKSGTSTLEAGLLELPHVVVYRTAKSTVWIFKRIIKYMGPVGLVNLVGGWRPGDPWDPTTRRRIVPEILMDEVTTERLARELERLLTDGPFTDEMKQRFAEMKTLVFGNGESPSLRAARVILEFVRSRSA